MLHSVQLKIKLPGAEEYTTFRTRVPGRFQKIEKKLRAKFTRELLPKTPAK
jgi:23S rRNA pseudouridine1911/1915/1917 synthase